MQLVGGRRKHLSRHQLLADINFGGIIKLKSYSGCEIDYSKANMLRL